MAPEEEEANEEDEEQDGRESRGPCLPSMLLFLLKVVCSVLCYFAQIFGNNVPGSYVGRVPAFETPRDMKEPKGIGAAEAMEFILSVGCQASF